ncbi:hypothetical protein NJO91_03275 [Streptomyces microflavus]|uniref:hypothetical protein n=1 Tax=Streptomyces microflavus TaxID=1919 RepID=UPI0029AB28DE|nr:hypothetical protein [Streptomyces microflavus]MDX2402141.1 hypothetical protein [Streptomyces microflavus]
MSAAELEGGDWIRGITIRQPWATCILAGKSPENRPTHWSWRGWVLLHAGRQTDRPALRLPLVARTIRDRQLVTGAVVGIARITGCHQDPDGAPRSTVGWRRTNVAPYEPDLAASLTVFAMLLAAEDVFRCNGC